MIRRSSLVFACVALASALAAGTAEAQTTAPECPPGQPCVVVVPQQQPQPTPPPDGYVVVQPAQPQPTPPPEGYVVVQPAQPPPGYGQPQQPAVYGAQPMQQRQPVQVTETRIRWGLVGPGIGLLAGGWVANWLTGSIGTLAIALGSGEAGDYFGWSWVPVIGPFVNAGYMSEYDGFLGMHILWGVLQTGGLLMCILGTVLQEEVSEIRYVQADGLEIAVMPWADQTGAGASLSVVGF